MATKIKTVTMDKIDFKNLPDTTVPINSSNLKIMQDNTENAINDSVLTNDEIFNSLFENVDESNFKLKDNKVIDSTGIMHNEELLSKVLDDTLPHIPICGENGYSKNITEKDLNTIVDSGFYYGNNVVNGPQSYKHLYLISLCHVSSKKYSTQIAFIGNNTDTMGVFIRQQYNEVWSKWNKITTTIVG